MRNRQIRLHRKAKGFTLLELIMVLVILAAVMAMLVPGIRDQFGRAKSSQAKIQMEKIGGALDLFKLDVGRYPTQSEGLGALVTQPSGVTNWNGPYIREAKDIKDPWNHDFKYSASGSKFELISFGSDGKEGGTGEDADIKSGG